MIVENKNSFLPLSGHKKSRIWQEYRKFCAFFLLTHRPPKILWSNITFALLLSVALPIQAQELQHQTQQAVLKFLESYQPDVVSADRTLNFQELMAELEDKRVVFVGEQHDRYDHHLNQLAILQAMHKQNSDLAIGVEWFQQSFQSVLDDYLAGKIDEAAMLKQSGYYQRWRYDYRLLRPIIFFAKENQLPVIALNAPAEITAKVSEGGLEALSADERAEIPAAIHPAQDEYHAYLKKVFEEHMGGRGDLERFVLIQRIWDETMAANLLKQLEAHPQQRMIVFAGSGHTGRGIAIPGDVARSIPSKQLVTIHSVEKDKVEPGAFDYFMLSEQLSLPPTGKMGVWLDDKSHDGVSVLKLSDDSAAAKAGLEKGDRFISLDDKAVPSMADLLMVLSKTKPGQDVKVVIERNKPDSTSSEMLTKTIRLQ